MTPLHLRTLFGLHQEIRSALKTPDAIYSSLSISQSIDRQGKQTVNYNIYVDHPEQGSIHLSAGTPEQLVMRLRSFEQIGEIADVVLPQENSNEKKTDT